jgi:DNA-binding transcriptional ArsR family regulator
MSTIPLPEKPTTGLDYEADEYIHAETPQQLKALGNQLRMSLLDLLNERAASITELADAVGRPKGTVGYHVKVLEDTGFVRVVRTRRVRAMTEKLYGRTAHTIIFHGSPDPGAKMFMLQEALAEAVVEDESALASSTLRHVRMSNEQAIAFWDRVLELAVEFAKSPRGGDRVYGFLASIYPTDLPVLPENGEGA